MNTYNIDKMYENYSSEIERMQKFIDELQQENEQLKDNWNKLKQYLNEGTFYYKTGTGKYTTEIVDNRINGLDTLHKIQELEQGSGSDE